MGVRLNNGVLGVHKPSLILCFIKCIGFINDAEIIRDPNDYRFILELPLSKLLKNLKKKYF